MQGPTAAYLSVEPVTYAGYSEAQYQKLLRQAGVGVVTKKGGSTCSYAVQNVIGVRLGKKGTIEVAVVWATDNPEAGGTWEPLASLNTTFEAEMEETDDEEEEREGAIPRTKAEKQAELEQSVSSHNWQLYFGQDVDEDLDVICAFSEGTSVTSYQGIILTANYAEQTGHHHIHFPVMHASCLFGTAAQAHEGDHIVLRLDTLECPTACHEKVKYWVKRDFVGLPFIQQGLGLKVDAEPKQPHKRKGRKPDVSDSSSDAEDEVHEPSRNQPNKKMTRAQQKTQELMEQMRTTPM